MFCIILLFTLPFINEYIKALNHNRDSDFYKSLISIKGNIWFITAPFRFIVSLF